MLKEDLKNKEKFPKRSQSRELNLLALYVISSYLLITASPTTSASSLRRPTWPSVSIWPDSWGKKILNKCSWWGSFLKSWTGLKNIFLQRLFIYFILGLFSHFALRSCWRFPDGWDLRVCSGTGVSSSYGVSSSADASAFISWENESVWLNVIRVRFDFNTV